MNKKNIIICGIILFVLILITILVLVIDSNMDANSDIDNTDDNEDTVITSLEVVSDENDFFTVKNIINSFLELVKWNDADSLYNVINDNYINENGITLNNILTRIDYNYFSPNYVATDMYMRVYQNISYYFVDGYVLDFTDSDVLIDENVDFIVLIANNYYNIIPIEEGTNFEQFVNNYEYSDDFKVSGENAFETYDINVESKLITYIQEFINLLYADVTLAYDMLDEDAKEDFGGLSGFSNYRDAILNDLSPIVFSYSVTEAYDFIRYNIVDNNQNVVTIEEFGIMDYTINLKNNNFVV